MGVRNNDSTCKIEGIDFNLVASCTEKNIIKVSAKREIFFDVFECTINGDQTLVLEKVDEVDMLPIVNIQFTRDNKIYTCEAVLIEDIYEEFIINEDNIYFNSYIPTESEDSSDNDAIDEQTFTDEVVEDYDVLDSDIDIDDQSKSNHIPYQDQKDTFIQLLDEQLNSKLSSLKIDFSSQLEVFLKEVNNGSNTLIGEKLTEIDTVVEEKFQNLKEDIKHIEEFSKQNITEAIKKKISEIEGFFNTYLENIVADNEQREDKNLTQINNNLLKINTVEESLLKSYNSIDTLQNKIRLLEELESKIITLDDIKERFIDEDRVAKESKNIIKFVTEKILELSDNIQTNSEKQEKKYNSFIDSIRVEDVKEVKTIIHDKIDDAQINQLKENLQSDIEKSLKGDIVSLKRYVEMSSGGGSVAKQFANGGIMDGDLNVNGNILSGGRNLDDIFATDGGGSLGEYLPLSGGNLTGLLSSTNTIIAETILATNILSATNLDIGYELSGFNVTGSISANGNLSASDIYSSGDIKVDGNIGIGTSTPSEKLHVIGKALIDGDLEITGDSSFQNRPTVNGTGVLLIGEGGGGTDVVNTTGDQSISGVKTFLSRLEVSSSTTDDTILITTTEDSSSAAPVITLKRNSSSVSNGDYLGQIKFKGENDADQEIVYAKITAKISDDTDTTEDGLIEFAVKAGGSNVIVARQTSSDLKLINGVGLEVDGGATFDDTVTVEGSTTVGKITLSDNSFVTETSSFTLGSTHRGATVLLQNTGLITITVPSQVAGHTTTFIAETSNSVIFTSGTGLSAFNSFNSANQIAGIFGQAQIIFKSSTEAFLGGNVV